MSRVSTFIALAALALWGGRAYAGLVPQGTGMPLAPASSSAETASFRSIARLEAERVGLPYDLVDAVMKIESNYVPSVVGGVGEIGLMQVLPTTAQMLGFHGLPDQLSEPSVNIHYGATYLGQAWHLTKGDVCRTLMKYRAGHGAETMSPLSVSYCARAKAHLAAVGSPLAALITPADLVASITEPTNLLVETSKGVTRPKTGEAFWTAFKARIKKINSRIEAKWARTAAR